MKCKPANIKTKFINHVINFIQAQLVVTLAAIPILVNWGLSISLLTFLGNFIFSPALTLFLILSSLVFFTQLLHIPNGYLVALLDWFTTGWASFLGWGHRSWLIEFCHPPILVLMMLPIATVIVMHHLRPKTNGRRILILTGALLVTLTTLWLVPRINRPDITKQPAPEGLTITPERDGGLAITDDGYFSQKKSPSKAIEFELKPYLVKYYGHVTINQLTLVRTGQRSFEAAQTLCTVFDVKKVVLPYFNKKLSKNGWRTFFNLTRFLTEKNILFIRTHPALHEPEEDTLKTGAFKNKFVGGLT